MTDTQSPAVGIVGIPSVAQALRELGFRVITADGFRDAATAISNELQNRSFPVVLAELDQVGFIPWATSTASKTRVVQLVTLPDLHLTIPGATRVELPSTVNALMPLIGYQPSLAAPGDVTIQADTLPEPEPQLTAQVLLPAPVIVEVPAEPPAIPAAPLATTMPEPTPVTPPALPAPAYQFDTAISPIFRTDGPDPEPEPAVEAPSESAFVVDNGDFDPALFTTGAAPAPAPIAIPVFPAVTPQPVPAAIVPEPVLPKPVFSPEPAVPPFQPPAAVPAMPAPVSSFVFQEPVPVPAPEPAPVPQQPAVPFYDAPAEPGYPTPEPVAPIPAPVVHPAPAVPAYTAPFVPAVPAYTAPVVAPTPTFPAAPVIATPDEDDLFDTRASRKLVEPAYAAVGARRTRGELLIYFAGKGGVGKTSQSLVAAKMASEAGLRTVLVDGNRGQADIRTYLRLPKDGLASVYDAARTGDPSAAFLLPGQYNQYRPPVVEPLDFAIVQGPPRSLADPSVVPAEAYASVIDYARSKADLVILDTQIIEAHKSDLFERLIIPAMISGAWSVAIVNETRAGADNLLSALSELAARGVTNAKSLVIASLYEQFDDIDRSAIERKYAQYGKFVGSAGIDPAFKDQLNIGNILTTSPAIAPVTRAILYRITGNQTFAPVEATGDGARGRRGLFGRRRK